MINWYHRYKTVIASFKGDDGHYDYGYKVTDLKSLGSSPPSYIDIGHGTEDKPILWAISDEGEILIAKDEDEGFNTGDYMVHQDGFDGINPIGQGRVIQDRTLGNITSAGLDTSLADSDVDCEWITRSYVEKLLRQKFGSNLKIYWF